MIIYLRLFITFFYIGLFTFGGGYAMIPLIQDEVISHGWANEETLQNFIAVSESTPGPFAINIATFIGADTAGVLGSICSTLGVVLPSFIIILIIAILINKVFKKLNLNEILVGAKPVVISLILSTTFFFFMKMLFGVAFNYNNLSSLSFDRKSLTLFLVLLMTTIIYKKRQKKSLNPIFLLILSGALGIFIFA